MATTSRHIFISLTAAAIVAAFTPIAQAQYAGPLATPTAPRTVADILKNPVDDQPVVLRGFLLRQIKREKYMFSDGTAEIKVDIDTKRFPFQRIDEKTAVELHGHVDKDLLTAPEIDVDVVIVPTAN